MSSLYQHYSSMAILIFCLKSQFSRLFNVAKFHKFNWKYDYLRQDKCRKWCDLSDTCHVNEESLTIVEFCFLFNTLTDSAETSSFSLAISKTLSFFRSNMNSMNAQRPVYKSLFGNFLELEFLLALDTTYQQQLNGADANSLISRLLLRFSPGFECLKHTSLE